MTQIDRLEYLVAYLLREDNPHGKQAIPQDANSKKRRRRGLLNVRLPKACTAEFLRTQDNYLQAETVTKGVTDAATLPTIPGDNRLAIWQCDITMLAIGTIVNAANSGMLGCFCTNHGCINNVIHMFSGVQLPAACAELMRVQGKDYFVLTANVDHCACYQFLIEDAKIKSTINNSQTILKHFTNNRYVLYK